MHKKFLIIGAGPAGIGAAYRLRELGENDYFLVERNTWIGGLAASFVDERGFTWDIGGHVQFSHYKYFDDAMAAALGSEGWLSHERESWVWMYDRFVPYPFQNNVRYLPKEAVWRCLKGVIEATKNAAPKPSNFLEWIHAVFGEGIAQEFMIPYNFKVWGFEPEKMAYQWIGERVSVVDLNRVAENIVLQKDDLSWGPNNLFKFPKHGGTGSIWRSLGEKIGTEKIRTDCSVTKIDPAKKCATLSDGTSITYDFLLSTVPVDTFAAMVEGIPDAVKRRASYLKHSSSNIVGIGLKGQPKAELATKCWMYFPEQNCPFYRVTLFSKYSPNNVPDHTKFFSLMTETSESSDKPVNHEKLTQDTIDGLVNTKLIQSPHDVVSTWVYRASYGYPTPSLERDRILAEVQPELEKSGLYSRGRFGGWKYEVSNQDHTFMQGVEWSDRIVQQKDESTYRV